MHTLNPGRPADPLDLLEIDSLLTTDERAVHDAVRTFCDRHVEPHIAEWFEQGSIDDIRGLTKELGELCLLGMHLEGCGCAGMSAVDYGLACLELEATDSGLRSLLDPGSPFLELAPLAAYGLYGGDAPAAGVVAGIGIRAAAVHSTADAHARHVIEADTAVALRPGGPADGYLDIEQIVEAALRTGAQAIHPGYGFLSENQLFARAVTDAGLAFVGPPATAIQLMGDKIRCTASISAFA